MHTTYVAMILKVIKPSKTVRNLTWKSSQHVFVVIWKRTHCYSIITYSIGSCKLQSGLEVRRVVYMGVCATGIVSATADCTEAWWTAWTHWSSSCLRPRPPPLSTRNMTLVSTPVTSREITKLSTHIGAIYKQPPHINVFIYRIYYFPTISNFGRFIASVLQHTSPTSNITCVLYAWACVLASIELTYRLPDADLYSLYLVPLSHPVPIWRELTACYLTHYVSSSIF